MTKHRWVCPTCGHALTMHIKTGPPTCPHPDRAVSKPTLMKEKK